MKKGNMDLYKSVKISIGVVMKNLETLRFAPDYLEVKKMCKHAVRNLTYLIKYASDKCKTQQTCDRAILENGEILKFVFDCYKYQ